LLAEGWMNVSNDDQVTDMEFSIHPNGGGRVCLESTVTDEVYLAPEVIVVRSEIYRKTSIKGKVFIEDCEISRSIIDTRGSELSDQININNCHLTGGSILGPTNITGCFFNGSKIEATEEVLHIEYFYIAMSYLAGNLHLVGHSTLGPHAFQELNTGERERPFKIPTYVLRSPYSLCPEIICSHIEGDIQMTLPHTTEIHSSIIKPHESKLKAHPNKLTLEERLASIPAEKSSSNILSFDSTSL